MIKKAIFFLHYENNNFTQENFNLLKKYNEDWDIFSIGFKEYELLDYSLKAEKENYPKNIITYNRAADGMQADLLIYESYRLKPNYDKYFFLEYDTVFNTSIDSFFPDIYKSECCTTVGYLDSLDPNWDHLKRYLKNNPQHIKESECSISGVTTCMCFDSGVLRKISEEVINNKKKYKEMFSELRLGSIIKKFIKPNEIKEDIDNYISWTVDNIKLDFNKKEYFYHPIRTLSKDYETIQSLARKQDPDSIDGQNGSYKIFS